MAQTITIEITPDGMTIDTAGFKGKACLDTLDKLIQGLSEDGINTDVKKTKLKSEYYAKAGTKERTRSGNL